MQKYVNTRLARKIHDHGWEFGLSQHPDLTIETIAEFPDCIWEWDVFDTHPNFSFEKWVDRFPDKPWDWYHLHLNENFSFENWVAKYPDKNWNWTALSRKATIHDVLKFPNFPWRWNILTICSDITPKEMVRNSHLPWQVDLIRFESIEDDDDLEFLYYYKDEFSQENWDDFTRRATWDIIKKSMDLYWVVENIRFEHNFEQADIDFLKIHIDREWNWSLLSLVVPFGLIQSNSDIPWNYHLVSINQTVTYDDVELNPNLPWDYIHTPCEPIEHTIRKWVAAKKIQTKWRACVSNPQHPTCRKRLLFEFDDLITY